MDNKFLPIGSIVLLNGGIKKLMITGFTSISKEKPNETYDYCGCLYPEGVLTSDSTFLFNHDQIKEIVFKGYTDKEEEVFKEKLNMLINNNNSDNTEVIN